MEYLQQQFPIINEIFLIHYCNNDTILVLKRSTDKWTTIKKGIKLDNTPQFKTPATTKKQGI